MQPYPRSPDLVWPGHLHGTGCLSARAVGTGFSYCCAAFVFGSGWRLGVGFVNPASPGWGLGWVCLGTVCGVVPLVSAVCGVRGWASVSACFCPPPFPAQACGVGVCAGPGSRLCPALLGWVLGVCFLRFCCFFFFFGVPYPGGPLFLAWCCRFWVGGPPVPLWGSCLRCLLGGGFGRLWWCWRAVWRLWAVFVPFLPPPSFFFWGGGRLPVPPCAFPGLAHTLACIQCCFPGCCLQLRSVWPRSGPMGRVGYVHGGLGAPSCQVRSLLCRLGGCARQLPVVLG